MSDQQQKVSSVASVGAGVALAVLIHFVWAVGFIVFFRAVQNATLPEGDLSGIDLTSHAIRDEWMVRGFALSLGVIDILLLWRRPDWAQRIVLAGVFAILSVATFVTVFFSLLAG